MSKSNGYIEDGMIISLRSIDIGFIKMIQKLLYAWDPAGMKQPGGEVPETVYEYPAFGIFMMITKTGIFYGDDLNEDYINICRVLPEKRDALPEFIKAIPLAMKETGWYLLANSIERNLPIYIVEFPNGMRVGFNENHLEEVVEPN